MTVAVIYGGKSGEHEISLMSGAAVARHIHEAHCVVLIAITKDGAWFLQDEAELTRIKRDETAALTISTKRENMVTVIPGGGEGAFKTERQQLHIDVVFPVLHGTYGEDGTVQGLLEIACIPYVGCNVLASALTMDKEKTKALLASRAIPVVPYVTIRRADLLDSRVYDELIQKAIADFGFPLFVKPCCAGSSDGASKARNEKELSLALLEAFNWDNKVLIEKAINARELECAVTGNAVTASPENECECVRVYGPGEIMLTHEFYDYNAKYHDSDSVHIPACVSDELRTSIRSFASCAYEAVDAHGLCRIDFFLDKDSGALYLNEINSMPGFTAISMFPKVCEAEGVRFTDLTELLIREALLSYKSRSALQTSRD